MWSYVELKFATPFIYMRNTSWTFIVQHCYMDSILLASWFRLLFREIVRSINVFRGVYYSQGSRYIFGNLEYIKRFGAASR